MMGIVFFSCILIFVQSEWVSLFDDNFNDNNVNRIFGDSGVFKPRSRLKYDGDNTFFNPVGHNDLYEVENGEVHIIQKADRYPMLLAELDPGCNNNFHYYTRMKIIKPNDYITSFITFYFWTPSYENHGTDGTSYFSLVLTDDLWSHENTDNKCHKDPYRKWWMFHTIEHKADGKTVGDCPAGKYLNFDSLYSNWLEIEVYINTEEDIVNVTVGGANTIHCGLIKTIVGENNYDSNSFDLLGIQHGSSGWWWDEELVLDSIKIEHMPKPSFENEKLLHKDIFSNAVKTLNIWPSHPIPSSTDCGLPPSGSSHHLLLGRKPCPREFKSVWFSETMEDNELIDFRLEFYWIAGSGSLICESPSVGQDIEVIIKLEISGEEIYVTTLKHFGKKEWTKIDFYFSTSERFRIQFSQTSCDEMKDEYGISDLKITYDRAKPVNQELEDEDNIVPTTKYMVVEGLNKFEKIERTFSGLQWVDGYGLFIGTEFDESSSVLHNDDDESGWPIVIYPEAVITDDIEIYGDGKFEFFDCSEDGKVCQLNVTIEFDLKDAAGKPYYDVTLIGENSKSIKSDIVFLYFRKSSTAFVDWVSVNPASYELDVILFYYEEGTNDLETTICVWDIIIDYDHNLKPYVYLVAALEEKDQIKKLEVDESSNQHLFIQSIKMDKNLGRLDIYLKMLDSYHKILKNVGSVEGLVTLLSEYKKYDGSGGDDNMQMIIGYNFFAKDEESVVLANKVYPEISMYKCEDEVYYEEETCKELNIISLTKLPNMIILRTDINGNTKSGVSLQNYGVDIIYRNKQTGIFEVLEEIDGSGGTYFASQNDDLLSLDPLVVKMKGIDGSLFVGKEVVQTEVFVRARFELSSTSRRRDVFSSEKDVIQEFKKEILFGENVEDEVDDVDSLTNNMGNCIYFLSVAFFCLFMLVL